MPLYFAKKPAGLKYVGSDITPGYSTTATETVIGQVTIPSNTVKTFLIAIASLFSKNATINTHFYDFRIRCGTAGDTTDTQYAQQLSKTRIMDGGIPTETGNILTYITGPDWTVQNYVSVTVLMDTTSEDVQGACTNLVVIGE